MRAIKKLLILMMTATMLAAYVSCNPSSNGGTSQSNSQDNKEVVIQNGYTRVDVGESNGKKVTGFGTQFDSCIVEKENGLTDKEWDIQVNAIKEMRLQTVRVRFFPEPYERANDNDDPFVFDFDSPNVDFNSLDMQVYYKLFDVFEENNVKVDLSWYGCRTTFKSCDGKIEGSWLGGNYGESDVSGWVSVPQRGANPDEEFAESVAACLKYLLVDKGYTCINEYSVFPEPEGVIGDINRFGRILKSIQNRLEKYGIADKLTLSGPADYNNNSEIYENKYLSVVDFERASSSVYLFNAGSSNEEMYNFAKSYTEVTDKYGLNWTVSESGTSNFIDAVHNSDSDSYDRALFMARFSINLVNGGCTGIKYFVFSDCYYDGILNELGLFKFRHEGWKAKPVYYSWSLITRYTEIGSEIYPIESGMDNVCMTAFKLPDGSWTYLLANNGKSNAKVAIVNEKESRPAMMNLYRLTGSLVPENGELKTLGVNSQVDASSGVAHITVPANGFIVLSNKVL